MSVDIWYYTLSTIAQTLASLLGLAAVFCVLRLQSLSKNIQDFKGRAINILRIRSLCMPEFKNNSPTFKDETNKILEELREFNLNYKVKYRAVSGMDEMINEMAAKKYFQIAPDDHDIYFIKDTFDNLDSFIDQRNEAMKFVRAPGLLAAVSIGLSITLLGLSDQISDQCLLFSIVILAILSLGWLIRNSWKILNAIRRLE